MKITIDEKEYDIEEVVSDLILLISRERDAYKRTLERLSRLGNGDIQGNSDGNIIAQKVLNDFDT
ncbi:MAG: hypothetical protein JKY96_04595 [Phycisphaerales bacterium]|nr:hypothetical protein [Phycisphaerales bacterium]